MKRLNSVSELKKEYLEEIKSGKLLISPYNEFEIRFPYKPRFLNMIYAFFHSYFWLPCPICGKKFGGHEYYGSIGNLSGGEGICPECTVKQYNETGSRDNIKYE